MIIERHHVLQKGVNCHVILAVSYQLRLFIILDSWLILKFAAKCIFLLCFENHMPLNHT